MPMSDNFKKRLFPALADIVAHFGTPFHIYDEAGILASWQELTKYGPGIGGCMVYFVWKALPDPRIRGI